MRLKEIAIENRPISRIFEKDDASHLSDAELLAAILYSGTFKENIIDISQRLISKYGLKKLSSCSIAELREIYGIGKVKACQIKALFEFNKRHSLAEISHRGFLKLSYLICG